MRPLRIAHLGIAHDHSAPTLECVRNYPELYEVVGVTEADGCVRARMGQHAVYDGLPWLTEEELFEREDVDCVLVEGDELKSLADAQRCVQRGWHVHMDKPAGLDPLQFEQALRDAKRQRLVFQMGYMYRYNAAMTYLLDKVRSGKLGEIISIDASMGVWHTAQKRQWLSRFPGGMMFFLGCHLIDMILAIQGVPGEIIPLNTSTGMDGVQALDNACAVLKYDHCVATVRANAAEVNGYNRRHLVVCGTEGTVEIRPLECPTQVKETMRSAAAGFEWSDAKRDVFPGYMSGRYDAMMEDFAACVRGEKENSYDYAYEARLQRMLLSACGQPVDFRGSIPL